MPKLMRKRQFAAKDEVTEGTAETLTAADAGYLVHELKTRAGVRMNKRNPHRASLAPLTQIPGMRSCTMTGKIELKGSGSLLLADVPECFKLMLPCGYKLLELRKITIGAVTGGPFKALEKLTGGTSAGTIINAFTTATGASAIWYWVLAGGPIVNAEVLTGAESGATATTSGAPQLQKGHVLQPTSDSTVAKSQTTQTMNDGRRHKARGVRGRCQVQAKVGELAMVSLEYQGALLDPADVALFTGVVYQQTKPPPFLGAMPLIDLYKPVFSSFDFDMNQTLALREDAGDPTGILSCIVTDREPVLKLDPEADALANYNPFADWVAATEKLVDLQFGSVEANRIRFLAPKFEVTDIEESQRNKLDVDAITGQTSEKTFGAEDDHYWIHY